MTLRLRLVPSLSFVLVASSLAGGASIGCKSEVNDGGWGGQHAGGSGGQGTGGKGSNGGSGGEGGTINATCSTAKTASPATCNAGACTVDFDTDVACTEDDFAQGGVVVAPATEKTYLATSGYLGPDLETRLFDVDASGATQLGAKLAAAPVALSSDADGNLLLVGDETHAADYVGGLVALTGKADALTKTTIFDAPDRYSAFTDIGIDPSGNGHVFYISKIYDTGPHFYDYADGVVKSGKLASSAKAVAPGDTGYVHFALTSSGTPVGFEAVESGDGYQIRALVDGGQTADVGAPTSSTVLSYKVARALLPQVKTDAVAYALAVQDIPGIKVAYAQGDLSANAEVPNTKLLVTSCSVFTGTDGDSCPTDCHETASGVGAQDFAIARLPGDETVVAYVVTHLDQTYTYQANQGDDGPACTGNLTSDKSTAELFVVRVPMGNGAPVELLHQTIPVLDTLNLFADEGGYAIDVNSSGKDVAIALRQSGSGGQSSSGGAAHARVIRLTTN